MNDKTNVGAIMAALKGGKQTVTDFGGRALRAADDFAWGVGAIQPLLSGDDTDSQETLLTAVLQSLEPVSEAELPYSACTDGRLPVQLSSGDPVPVREQLVGADIVSAFYVAEVLGSRFYKDVTVPVADRIADVAAFLKENGLEPSSHISCGAGAGYVAITQNILAFTQEPAFTARLKELLPAEIYDEQLQQEITAATKRRLDATAYKDLSAQMFLDAVEKVSGKRAIAELQDDGRGVHGHVEEAIVRVRRSGFAINEAKVAELTGGRQVFGVSDGRMEKLAKLFGRGNDVDYRMAYLALEIFTDAGHGTLAKGLPTWTITDYRITETSPGVFTKTPA